MDASSRGAWGTAVPRPASTWLAEIEAIAGIGTWEVHLPSADVIWSRELFRLLDVEPDQVPSFELLVQSARAVGDDADHLRHGLRG